ncbi:hypothetical protein HOLleu_10378 [Holothuria leucospilota]|uniref:Uncharacterized protein n=1 Tax=Holothuria leucospilota TaxID=206669 RepID=A0A9Q1HEH5_HOLLE|nr:hypothetical protein HOLleu_10378 [Holothuria leucospilota]
MKGNEPRHHLRWKKLSLQSAPKLRSHRHNPTVGTAFNHKFSDIYLGKPTAVPPFAIRVRKALITGVYQPKFRGTAYQLGATAVERRDMSLALLPKLHEDQSYRVYDYKEDGNTVQCTLRLPLTTKDDALKWLKNFQETSFSTWRVDKTYPHAGNATGNKAKNIFRDVHIREGFPTIINLIWEHNHEVECADAFRKRDVNDTTKEKLLELFRAGHSPSSALDTLKYDLQSDNTNEEYLRLSADKSICPDLQYCYR